jgi:hypothetical protein
MPDYTPGQRLQLADGRTATVGADGVPRFDSPAPAQQQAPPSQDIIYGRPAPRPQPQIAPPEFAAALRPGGPGILGPNGSFTAPADPESEDMDALYNTTFQRERAKKDIARIEAASAGVGNASSMLATARQARGFLDDGAPTGPNAAFRLGAGKWLGGIPGAGVLGVPNTEQTNALTGFTQIAEGLALGDSDKLKGPMSDRDIELLRNMNASPNDTPEANRRAIAGREWAAARLMAYEAAQTRWAQDLGRPSSVNRAGQSFDQWWAQYAAENIPPPTGTGPYTVRHRGRERQPSAQERALTARFEADKRRIASLASRPRPGTPARPQAAKPISEMTDAELQALAGGR